VNGLIVCLHVCGEEEGLLPFRKRSSEKAQRRKKKEGQFKEKKP